MLENSLTLVIATTILGAVLASGAGIGFLVCRRKSAADDTDSALGEKCLPQRFVGELERCLELSDYVLRDADRLSALMIGHSPQQPNQISGAAQQLVKTARALAGRLNRFSVEAHVARPDKAAALSGPLRVEVDVPPVPSSLDAATLTGLTETSRSMAGPLQSADLIGDARQFSRSSFRGTASATIYPRHPGSGREPIQCTVLTRDLSCGGIGIAHSEQLFPEQIIVLDAVGKLLVGEIRWCRRLDEQFYVAGCRLVKTHD
jgi:hypothetical protein